MTTSGGDTPKDAIAFIGLGIMGGPMAANLVAAGHSVTGFNRSEAAVNALVEVGGKAATSIARAVQGASVVITMLPDSPDVRQVCLQKSGVFDSAAAGTLVIDMSTIRPDVAVELASEASGSHGLSMIDAPVSGGEPGAVDGSLSIMVGGEVEAFEQARPVLDVLGTTIARVGPAGSGQTVKAANQLIVAGTIELVAESIVFLEAHGVDVETALAVLNGGLAGSRVLERKGPTMARREFAPGFRVDLHHKDLGIALDAARKQGVAVPVGGLVGQLMGSLRAEGDGSLDHSALLKLVAHLSGRSGSADASALAGKD